MTEVELFKLSEALLRQLEPMIRREVERCLEESLTNVFAFLGDELARFAKMRKQGDI